MTIDRAANAIAEDGVATRLALPLVSFVIKAFNEEAKIAACIESVLKATREVPGRCEVILAGRTEASLAALGLELESEHVVVDATSFDGLDQAVQRFGPVNAVVNCVAVLVALRPALLKNGRVAVPSHGLTRSATKVLAALRCRDSYFSIQPRKEARGVG